MPYVQVPEYKIRQAVKIMDGQDVSHLSKALADGDIIRDNGLTPFYILHEEQAILITTSLENMENKLN